MTSRISARPEYFSIGANRHTAAADWSEDGLLAFGADVNIAFWRPGQGSRGIESLIHAHDSCIKAVKFTPRDLNSKKNSSSETAPLQQHLVTGATDGTIKVWSISSGTQAPNAAPCCVQLGATVTAAHDGAVNCIAAVGRSSGEEDSGGSLIITGGADATIRVWHFAPALPNTIGAKTQADADGNSSIDTLLSLRLIQTLRTANPGFIPLCLAVAPLTKGPAVVAPGTTSPTAYILAAAGTRNSIFIYTADDVSITAADSSVGEDNNDKAPSKDISASSQQDSLIFTAAATLSGHDGWIHSLDLVREPSRSTSRNGADRTDEESSALQTTRPADLLLASASQDKYIRLWRVQATSAAKGGVDATADTMRWPGNKTHRFSAGVAGEHSITFEALLLGHEDWIYAARWHVWQVHEHSQNQRQRQTRMQLLSASADNSLAVWEADTVTGIWTTVARLGEISREKGASTATGSTGGFWNGLWSPAGDAVVTLGRTGGWRLWWRRSLARQRDSEADTADATENDAADVDTWSQDVAVGGHVKSVTGLTWEPQGRYLLSTSHDQTTRLHGRWTRSSRGCSKISSHRDDNVNTVMSYDGRFHEFARPQIHGYDLNCIAALSPTSFVSGANEKLMRVFGMTRAVAEMLGRLSTLDGDTVTTAHVLPTTANLPVLGLSNKAATGGADEEQERNEAGLGDGKEEGTSSGDLATTTLSSITHPPFDDVLSRHTLFPETEKLYGHGFELSCLAAATDGSLIASACKATSAEHAVIRLFETAGWTELRPPLRAHALTCTRLRFAGGGKGSAGEPRQRAPLRLLSVGRDRKWAVFEQCLPSQRAGGSVDNTGQIGEFRLVGAVSAAHRRMILDCAWAPMSCNNNEREEEITVPTAFVTAGRDKVVKFWKLPATTTPSFSTAHNSERDDAAGSAGGTDGRAEHKAKATEETSLDGTIIVTESSAVTAVDILPFTVGGAARLMVLAVGTESGKLSVHVGSEHGGGGGGGGCSFRNAAEYGLTIDKSIHLPKAIQQLAWRPAMENGCPELAVAGEDGSLRILSFPGFLELNKAS